MDKNINPKISVLMPVYNCRPFIEESVNSILNQTFKDFEFIIIDDCSTDGTYEYLQTLTDPRISIFRNKKNSGIAVSLNLGLEMAKGIYIARMDGDDISFPDRFAKQVTFMDEHPEIILCGGGYQSIGSSKFIFVPKSSHEDIILYLMSYSPIAHPTVFFRTKTLTNNNIQYQPEFVPAEDYKMWTVLSKYGKLANITDIVLYYRVHKNQISSINTNIQSEIAKFVAFEYIMNFSKRNEHTDSFCRKKINSIEDLKKYEDVEAIIKQTLIEKGIKANDCFFQERKKQYLIYSLIQNRYSITQAVNDMALLFKCRSTLGNMFIFKHLIKCLTYYKIAILLGVFLIVG